MRARFDGNSVASRHVPHDAERTRARRRGRSGRGPCGTATARWRATARAQPGRVGDGGAEPAGFHADAKSLHQLARAVRRTAGTRRRRAPRGRRACGWRRGCPTSTTIQAIAGPSELSRQRRTVALGADVRLGVAGPPVRRQPGAARGSAGRGSRRRRPGGAWRPRRGGRAATACAGAARRTPAATPTPRRGGR